MSEHTPLPSTSQSGRGTGIPTILFTVLAAAGLLWVWWSSLGMMVSQWSGDPRYSHGFLVPLFAVFLLWHRRDKARAIRGGSYWAGVGLIALGLFANYLGIFLYYEWITDIGILPAVAGLFVLFGGWPALRWAWPAVIFLFFMIPLPYRVEHALGEPLQKLATAASTFTLQTLGLPAVAEGTIISVNDVQIGVVEACNGLGMLVMFAAFSVAVAFLINRPILDKILILVSAVPTAVLANIIRITITGVLHTTVGGKVADTFYHDLAGWMMMPMALGILWLELLVLARLFLENRPEPVAVPVMGWTHPGLSGPLRPRDNPGETTPQRPRR